MGRGLTRNHLGEETGPERGLQPCSSAPTALPSTDLPGTSPGAPDGLHRLGVAKGHVQGDGIPFGYLKSCAD